MDFPFHYAEVVEVEDPERRGRIRFASASYLGTDEDGRARAHPEWAEPALPPGLWRAPRIGDGVLVYIEPTPPGVVPGGPPPLWVTGLADPVEVEDPRDLILDSEGAGVLWRSRSQTLRLQHPSGAVVTLTPDTVLLNRPDGTTVALSDESVTLVGGDGSWAQVGSGGVTVTGAGGTNLRVAEAVTAAAPNVSLVANRVDLGQSPTHPPVKGDVLAAQLSPVLAALGGAATALEAIPQLAPASVALLALVDAIAAAPLGPEVLSQSVRVS